jgi:hypothetical protein
MTTTGLAGKDQEAPTVRVPVLADGGARSTVALAVDPALTTTVAFPVPMVTPASIATTVAVQVPTGTPVSMAKLPVELEPPLIGESGLAFVSVRV